MENKQQLEQLRHSAAHLLAAAVVELYSGAKLTIGPAIDNGFYYDIDFPEAVSEKEFPKIEQKMRELVKKWDGFEKIEVSKEEALKRFEGNEYKQELIEEHSGSGEQLTLYKSGEFVDLCKGGHIENPKDALKNFKLLSIAGAYWRGNEKNKMLSRIYGTAFPTKEELEAYLQMLEEAKKRDHKKLGRELDLFTFSDLVGPGLPLWTPKGTLLRDLLDNYIWKLRSAKRYQKVTIPHITKKELYETSGHWSKFENELFKIKSREGHLFAMKPMNCPHHTQIFAHIPRSYKDMPQRYAETTMCYRDEQTGELTGLSRVRAFTQDDAHVFCRQNQIKDEFLAIWDIVSTFYATFGFQLKVRLSLHDPDNMKAYLGTEKMWNEAENALRDIAKEKKVDFYEAVGEAAFYGPKIDFIANDSLGREWQVATIQLDINMPERFNLLCTNEKGEEERIVMIHAAIMGSIERFLSILIEHYAGAFPLWLAPVQISIVPVSDAHIELAEKVYNYLHDAGIRVELRKEQKSVSWKIRQSALQKVPFAAIIGDTELQKSYDSEWFASVRTRDGKDLGIHAASALLESLNNQIETRN